MNIDRRRLLQGLGALGTAALFPGMARQAWGALSASAAPGRPDITRVFRNADRAFDRKTYSFGVAGGERWRFGLDEHRFVVSPAIGETPALEIGVRRVDAESRIDAWTTAYDEFICTLRGTYRVRIGDEVHEVPSRDMLWIPKGSTVSHDADVDAEIFYAIAGSAPRVGDLVVPASANASMPARVVRYADREWTNVPAQLRKFSDGTSRVQRCNFNGSRGVDVEHTGSMGLPAAAYANFPVDSMHGWMEIPYDEIIVGMKGTLHASLSDQRFDPNPSEIQTLDCGPGDVLWLPKGTYVEYHNEEDVEVFFMMSPGCCFDMAVPGEWETGVWEDRVEKP